MDFPTDSILMSHMGEGNWRLARQDRPVRLIKRPLGIGGLGRPADVPLPVPPGPATLATLVSLGGEGFRLLVCEGEILDTDELPALEMPYGFFRPDSRRARLHGRLASPRGPAPPGAQPGAAGARVACVLHGDRNRARVGLTAVAAVHSSPRQEEQQCDVHPSPQGSAGSRWSGGSRPGRRPPGRPDARQAARSEAPPGAQSHHSHGGVTVSSEPFGSIVIDGKTAPSSATRSATARVTVQDPHVRRHHPGAVGPRPRRPSGERHAGLQGRGRLPQRRVHQVQPVLRRDHRPLREPHRQGPVLARRQGVLARHQQRPQQPPRRLRGIRPQGVGGDRGPRRRGADVPQPGRRRLHEVDAEHAAVHDRLPRRRRR